uniref:Taste receptor type 2 n=1 Tax=Anolis carolinensis TaxID=28377 RepID=A0A803T837_ANOCA
MIKVTAMALIMSPLGVLAWATFGILNVMALLGNGFIIVVNGHQWLQSKKMIPYKFLLTTLSTSRFLLQMDSVVGHFMYLIFAEIQKETHLYASRAEVVNFIWMFLNMVSLWNASWLSMLYCVKVTNFANRLFIWLKARVNMLVPRLLGISIIVSTVFFFPSAAKYYRKKKWCNLTDAVPRNSSQREGCNDAFDVFHFPQLFLASVNFGLTLTASCLLLTSLWKHTNNLEKSGAAFKDLSTQLHFKVMMPLLVSLLFYVLYFPCFVLAVGDIFEFGRLERWASEIVLPLYAFVQSIILILTNPELKKVAASILIIRQRAS